MVSGQLGRFRQYDRSKWNFRCPFCGDSQKSLTSAHGYVFPNPKKPNRLSYKCFKCGHSDSLGGLLKQLDENIYKQYRRSLFQSNRLIFSGPSDPLMEQPKEAKKVVLHPRNFFTPILDLPEDHPSRSYIRSRCVPSSAYSRIWHSDAFWETVKQLKPDQKVRDGHDEPRVIFPVMDKTNTFMVGLQGRSLEPNAKLRYVDCQIMKDESYLFGQELINRDFPVLVVEGPIDSLFLENCVALCGATKNPKYLPDNRIFYLDQEPRNKHIMKRYEDLIEAGERLVFLPQDFWELDANDIAKQTGWSKSRFTEFVLQHVKHGLRAKLELAKWRKYTPSN